MAVYKIGDQEYEVDDRIQGEELISTLESLKARVSTPDPVPSTDEELIAGFESITGGDYTPEPMPSLDERARNNTVGAIDFGLTTLLSAVPATGGTIFGFMEGVADEIASGEFGSYEAAERIRQKAMDKAQEYSLQPFTESGRGVQEDVGGFLAESPTGRALTSAGIAAAPMSASLGMSPNALRYLTSRRMIDPQSGLPVGPLKRALKKYEAGVELIDDVPDLDQLIDTHGPDRAVDIMARRKISRGEDNRVLAGLRLENNQLVKDPLGEKAVNSGFRAGDVAMTKNANLDTQSAMLKMLKDKRRELAESSYPRRPIEAVGDVMVDRIKILNNRAKELRGQLDRIARGSAVDDRALPGAGVTPGLRGLNVDTSGIERAVLEGLDRIDMDLPPEVRTNTTLLNDFVKDKAAFAASTISEDAGSKSLIRKTIKLLNEARTADAYEVHKIKRQIDSMLDWESTKFKGIKGEGEVFAKNIRRQLNQAVRDVSPAYASVNDELSGLAGALGGFRDLLSKKIDWNADNLSDAIGQEMRKLETNYGVRPALSNAAKEIDNQVQRLGIDTPIDTSRLVKFSYALDERFRPSARGSFSGSIAGTISAEAAAQQSATQTALGLFKRGIEKLRSISDEDAMNTMQQILTRDKP